MSPSYVTKARGVLSPTFPSSHSTSHPGVRRTNPEKLEKKTTTKIAKLELSLSLPLTHGEHVVIEGISNALTKLFEEDHFCIITMMLMMLMITLQQVEPN